MKMSKRGRKVFEFTPELLTDIEDMASRGLTQEQIAHNIGMHPTTLSAKKSKLNELEQAIKKGQAKGIRAVTNALYDKACSGDTTSMIFFLCNRDRDNWKHVSKASEAKADGSQIASLICELISKQPG